MKKILIFGVSMLMSLAIVKADVSSSLRSIFSPADKNLPPIKIRKVQDLTLKEEGDKKNDMVTYIAYTRKEDGSFDIHGRISALYDKETSEMKLVFLGLSKHLSLNDDLKLSLLERIEFHGKGMNVRRIYASICSHSQDEAEHALQKFLKGREFKQYSSSFFPSLFVKELP